jgi:hypothetical protein
MIGAAADAAMNGQTNISPKEAGAQNVQAGYTSLMSEGVPTGETFYQVLYENETMGYSPTTQATNDMLYAEETQRMTEELPGILLDENLGDDYKRLATRMTFEGEREENPLDYQYNRDLLETPEEDVDAEYQDAKSLMLNSLATVSEYRQAQQASIDQSDLSTNQGFLESGADFLAMVIPFYEGKNIAELKSLVGQGTAGDMAQAFILAGSAKEEIYNAFKKMPIGQRTQAMQKFADAIYEANSDVFMTNRLTGRDQLQTLIYGGYEDSDKWLDNVFSVLDASIIGKPIKWGAEALMGAAKLNKVKGGIRATSPQRVAQDASATQARANVAEMIADETGEAAQALTGASRTDAIMDSVMPVVDDGLGIKNQVGDSLGTFEKAILQNPDMQDAVDRATIGSYTLKEIETAGAVKVHKLQNVTGVTSRNEMFAAKVVDDKVHITGMYGSKDGGWTNSDQAYELTRLALRGEGIGEEAITLMRKDEKGTYVPVDRDEVRGIPGEFMTSIDYDYDVKFSDLIGNWEKMSVKNNFFDRVLTTSKMGFQRHLLDPASMIDPHVVLGANAAVDLGARISKLMIENAKHFSDGLTRLPSNAQTAVQKYIKEANERGIDFNEANLRAEYGFGDEEIEVIAAFREYWDEAWVLRNQMDAKKLYQEGFHILEDATTGTRLYGKPMPAASVGNATKVIDPSTGTVRELTKDVKDALYESHGSVYKLRKPVEIDGQVIEHFFSTSIDMTRAVKTDDVVYPYRKGYYEVRYTSPHFIVKEMVGEGGVKYTKAVATAESIADADMYLQRMAKSDPEGVYSVRNDKLDAAERSGYEMDMYETYGYGNQRTRGERLEDATALVQGTEQSNILSPVDTMIKTSRSLGQRVAMFDYLNVTKQRFMEQYKDVLPEGRFPASLDEIGEAGASFTKEVADARTMFEYISYLEHGAINSMPAIWKGSLRAAADAFDVKGFNGLAKAVRVASDSDPIQMVKSLGFYAYIATNPLRQALLNAHQAVLLAPNFAKQMPKVARDLPAFSTMAMGKGSDASVKMAAKLSGRSESEIRFMWKEFQASGLPESIDYNNMLRGSLTDMAENASVKPGVMGRTIGSATHGLRRIGFDMGEWTNLSTAWLAHYNKAVDDGLVMNKSTFKQIAGETRNYTFNMNRAGDMAYNQNALAIVLQFLQVPHKSLTMLTTNRNLSTAQKVRLGVFSGLSFTLPAGAMYKLFGGALPDPETNPELHEAVVQGLEFYMINKALEGVTGLDSNIDFSSMSPMDPYGMYEMLHGVFTTDVGQLLATSPSGSLIMGDNPRLLNFLRTASGFFNPEAHGDLDPITMSNVFQDFGHMSSGYSNAFKAYMALRYEKSYTANGTVLDPKVSTPEAIAKLFGFGTMDEARYYAVNDKTYKAHESITKDVNKWYKEYTTRLNRQGITSEEINRVSLVLSQGAVVFRDSPKAQQQINTLLQRDIAKGNGLIFDSAFKAAGEMTPAEQRDLFNALPQYSDGASKVKEAISYMNDLKLKEE